MPPNAASLMVSKIVEAAAGARRIKMSLNLVAGGCEGVGSGVLAGGGGKLHMGGIFKKATLVSQKGRGVTAG